MRYVAVNNFSVVLGWFSVFLGRTSIKMHIMCLLKDTFTQWLCQRWVLNKHPFTPQCNVLPSVPLCPLSSTDVPFSSVIKIATLTELGIQTHVMSKALRAILRGLFCCPILAKGLLFRNSKPHLQASIQELKWHRLTMTTASKIANTKQNFSLVIDRNTSWTLSLLHSQKVHPSINVSVKGSSSS